MARRRFQIAVLVVALVLLAGVSAFAGAAASLQSFKPQTSSQYRNDRWHFALFLPDNLIAQEYDARGGQTIQFLDLEGNLQFQVSAWPYSEMTVHGDGVLKALSGTSDQADDLGTVQVLHDDIVKLLFTNDGIMYVVDTLPEDATSTIDILKSWEFK